MVTTARKPKEPDVKPDVENEIVDPIGDEKYPVDGAVYDVYHLDPSKGHRVFYGRLEAEDVQEAFFLSRWGGGRYTIQKKVRNEEGHQKIAKAVTWVIEGEHKGSAHGAPALDKEAPSAAAGTPSDLVQMGIMDVFQAQRDGAEMSRVMMMEYLKMNQVVMAKLAEPGMDWKVIVPLAVPLIEAWLGNRKSEPNTVELAKQLTEMATANRDDTPMDKMLEIFKQVLEVKAMVTEDAAVPVVPVSDNPLVALATQVAPEIVKTLQASREHDYGKKPAQLAEPGAPSPNAEELSMMPEWMKALREHFPGLVVLSARGRDSDGFWRHDPTVYADVLLDQLATEHQEALRLAMLESSFLDSLAAQLPAIQQNRAWFEELISSLRDRLTPDEEAPPTEEATEVSVEPAPEGDDTEGGPLEG